MGMYDYIRCKYPLPDFVDPVPDRRFQTKDTPAQWTDYYEISETGELLHEDYDIEDQSDPNAKPGSLESVSGCMTPVNKRIVKQPDFTGEISFHDFKFDSSSEQRKGWIEFSAYFVKGQLREIHKMRDEDGEEQVSA